MRRWWIVTGLVVGAIVGPAATTALAGGGCHGGATDGTGRVVELVDACFTPTVLRVDPGTEVTFVNRDSVVHNITANEWGHYDDFQPGARFTTRFQEDGTYPYACTYHPGMSGAIIVGSGEGSSTFPPVSLGNDEPAPTSTTIVQRTDSLAGRIGIGALGAVIGAIAGLGISRLRRAPAVA